MSGKSEADRRRKGVSSAASGRADPEQFERFVEAARELGCDEDKERFKETLRRAAGAKPKPLKAPTVKRKPSDRKPPR